MTTTSHFLSSLETARLARPCFIHSHCADIKCWKPPFPSQGLSVCECVFMLMDVQQGRMSGWFEDAIITVIAVPLWSKFTMMIIYQPQKSATQPIQLLVSAGSLRSPYAARDSDLSHRRRIVTRWLSFPATKAWLSAISYKRDGNAVYSVEST